MIFFRFTLSTKSDFKNFEKALIILLNYMTYTLDKLNVYKYFFYFQKLPFQIKKKSHLNNIGTICLMKKD